MNHGVSGDIFHDVVVLELARALLLQEIFLLAGKPLGTVHPEITIRVGDDLFTMY